MAQNKSTYNIFFVGGLFLLLFNPPILPFNSMHLIGVASILYLAMNHYVVLKGIETRLFLSFIVLFIYLTFTVMLHGRSFTNAIYPVYFIIDILPFSIAYKIYGEKRNYSFKDYMKNILMACSIEALTCLLAFFVPTFHEFFTNRLISYGYGDVVKELMGFRMYGFSGELTFGTPALLSIIAIYLIANQRADNKVRDSILACVLFLCAVINARIALVILITGFLVYLLSSNINIRKKLTIIGLLLILGILISNVLMPKLMNYSPETYRWLMYGINDIRSMFGGEKVSESYSYFTYFSNQDIFTLPSRIGEFLFGIGSTLMGNKEIIGITSDIGYVNDIWLGGIIYCILNYSFWVVLLKNIICKHVTKIFGLFLLVILLVLNIKGSIFSNNGVTYFLVIFSVIVDACENESSTDILN